MPVAPPQFLKEPINCALYASESILYAEISPKLEAVLTARLISGPTDRKPTNEHAPESLFCNPIHRIILLLRRL